MCGAEPPSLHRIVIGCGAATRASCFGPTPTRPTSRCRPSSHRNPAGSDFKRLREIANPIGVDTEVVSDTQHQAGSILATSTKSGKAASFSGKRWLDRLDPDEFHYSTRAHPSNVAVNPGTLPGTVPGSAIEIRIAKWDLISIATTQDDGDGEHAYDAQKVAYNRSWDDLDLESTFEHRRQEGLMFMRVLRLSASGQVVLIWPVWLRVGQTDGRF
jgi:hypothetical protein